MTDLDDSHHFFRHIKKSWMDGEFIDPAAFRLRTLDNGQFEDGLSINWVEFFQKPTPKEAVQPLCIILQKKGRTVGGKSRFALLEVRGAKAAAARFTNIQIVTDEEPDDLSHALVKGYHSFNEQVAEELAKVVITSFAAKT